MRKLYNIIFIIVFSLFILTSCDNEHYDYDEVHITLNLYNNIDDKVVQISYTKEMENQFTDNNINITSFGHDTSKDGYIFFGGYSQRNGQGEKYIGINNLLYVKTSENKKYWNFDIYLHYEKKDDDNITKITYNLPEDCFIDGNLPIEFEIGKKYTLPDFYLDEHYFLNWQFQAVYDNFTSDDFLISLDNESSLTWSGAYSNIVISPKLSKDGNNYYIDSAEDFNNIRNHPNGDIVFIKDIDMSGIDYIPFEFSGTIEGNEHSITNLRIISNSENVGIFTNNKGKIKDLIIENITINSLNNKANYVGALAGTSSGDIINVSVNGTINSKNGIIGGIIGEMTGKELNNCMSDLNIISTGEDTSYIGGIVGRAENCKISFSTSNTRITATSTTIGGVVGSMVNCNMEYCYNKSNLIVVGSTVGGIVGNAFESNIKRCENSGDITGGVSVGGVVGVLDKTNIEIIKNTGEIEGLNYVGGIIGMLTSSNEGEANLTDLTNEGKVSASGSGAGGIIGFSDSENATFNISNVKNTAKIIATFDSVGGIIGGYKNHINFNDEELYTSIFTELINEGEITGRNNIGGLVGSLDVIGYNQWGRKPGAKIEITNSHNIGNISGKSYVGGLVGIGIGQDGKGSVIKDSYSTCKVQAENTIGGIAGYLNYITVDTCSNKDSSIFATFYYQDEEGKYARIGGYCGVGSEFINCVNEIDITYNEAGNYIGGIVGECNGNLTSCVNKGNIIVTKSSKVGGIAGFIKVDREYKAYDLLNEGDIEAYSYVGGIIGDFFEEMLALQDNDTHITIFDKLINYGNLKVGKDYGGVISSVYGNATNENLRFPTVMIAITNIENHGNIVLLTYPFNNVGSIIGYMKTDNEGSYIKDLLFTGKINGIIATESEIIGNYENVSFSY